MHLSRAPQAAGGGGAAFHAMISAMSRGTSGTAAGACRPGAGGPRPRRAAGMMEAAGTALQAAVLAAFLACTPAAASGVVVPDIGTAGAHGITVAREQQYGEYFMRTVRAGGGVIDDPVLTEYLSTVGGRLVASAGNVRFPFEFFLSRDDTFNAAAFLGGKIKVNTGLFRFTDSEDELAAVLAHEVVHVTQRHIARFVEARSSHTALTTTGLIGAIAMSIINPMVGMAAFSTAVGMAAQTSINFTRDNELEADRLSIALLDRAGYSPHAAVELFRKLDAMQTSAASPALALLRDHPLSAERLSEAAGQALSYRRRSPPPRPDFELARARVAVRYGPHRDLQELRADLEGGFSRHSGHYRNYALALIALEQHDTAAARSRLAQLGASLQHNLFVVDVLTDLDLSDRSYQAAISRLQALQRRMPRNRVVIINLANAYLQSGRIRQARDLLTAHLRQSPGSLPALSLLAEAQDQLGDRCGALQTQGELLEFGGNHNLATARLNEALQVCGGRLERERIKARVVQIAQQRAFDEGLSRGP